MTKTSFRTEDFTPIFAWSVGNQLLVVPPDIYKTFDEFLREAKTRTLRGAIPVRGGTSHLAGLLLADGLNINVKWMPYEGSASSIAALARNDVDFTICLATAVPSWVRAGKIRLLAVFPDRRGPQSHYFRDIPTLKELGYHITYVTIRHVVEGPPNTPPHIVRIVEDVALAPPRVVSRSVLQMPFARRNVSSRNWPPSPMTGWYSNPMTLPTP